MTMAVCYFGTYEADYERNRILRRALEENGVRVVTCHEPVWETQRHKTGTLSSPGALLRLSARLLNGYQRLARSYLAAEEHDVVLVGYLGHLDVLVAAPLCRLRKKPLVFDAFISLYDTLVHDRRLVSPASPIARTAKLLDQISCAAADMVLLDTHAHAAYFADELGVRADKCRRVLVGADPSDFFPEPAPPDRDAPFTVLQYSKFAPLHGIEHVLEAARLLRDVRDVRFMLVGGGQLEGAIDAQIASASLGNVERVRWMEPAELRRAIARAGVCLGVFGATDKAARVIPNKVYQCMAVGAPIITRDSAAIRELLTHEENVLLCPAADARALADAIVRVRDDDALREKIGAGARRLFVEQCTPGAIGRELVALLGELR